MRSFRDNFMPPLVQIKMQLKNSGINAALLRRCEANTRLLPDRLANAACGAIAYKAMKRMPKVPIARMDQELEVQSQAVTKAFHDSNGQRGGLSFAKKPRYRNIVSHMNSLASRIVLASFYANSPFNQRTGGVFARSKPATKGSAAFWEWVANAAARMTKARHSSSGFYWACAYAVNIGFGIVRGKIAGARWVPNEENPSMPGDVNKISKLLAKGLAQITPAQNGSGRAGFSVAATESDTKGGRGDLERVAQKFWQEAVDEEAVFQESRVEQAYVAAIEDAGILVS